MSVSKKTKQITSVSLIAILLLVGFLAEYTHRHVMPSAGPAVFVSGGDPPSGPLNQQQLSHVCFICQIPFLAVESLPWVGLFVLNAQEQVAIVDYVVPPRLENSFVFLLRAPPIFSSPSV
jgi:hypothetical protein